MPDETEESTVDWQCSVDEDVTLSNISMSVKEWQQIATCINDELRTPFVKQAKQPWFPNSLKWINSQGSSVLSVGLRSVSSPGTSKTFCLGRFCYLSLSQLNSCVRLKPYVMAALLDGLPQTGFEAVFIKLSRTFRPIGRLAAFRKVELLSRSAASFRQSCNNCVFAGMSQRSE